MSNIMFPSAAMKMMVTGLIKFLSNMQVIDVETGNVLAF